MAVACREPADLCDLDAGTFARPVSEVFDVRIGGASAEDAGFWHGDVSLRDMLGGSLVTYEEHMVPAVGEEGLPMQPKVVYVQCQGVDPVTSEPALVIVPAQLSLDVYADSRWNWSPGEEEEEQGEEEAEEETKDDDRRKLKSSIKGDPILLRAKPAPPPDPHFAPLRAEAMHCTNLLSNDFASPRSQTAPPRGKSRKGVAESSATMSSFLKSSGKDKFSRSRLTEIDKILDQTVPRHETEDVLDKLLPEMAGLHTLDAVAQGDPRKLAVHMAMHIKQMPKYQSASARSVDLGIDDDGGDFSKSAMSTEQVTTSEVERKVSKLSTVSSAQRSRRDAQIPGVKATPRAKLKDLDPHVSLAGIAPSQRLHSNWPDGLKRQVARHYYDMSPGQILDEEEKERLRDYQSRASRKETGTGDMSEVDPLATGGSTQSSAKSRSPFLMLTKGSPERLARERQLKRSTAGMGKVAHGLEIRIKNTERAGRFVVGRHTERARGREEAAARPTMLLDTLTANAHLAKY